MTLRACLVGAGQYAGVHAWSWAHAKGTALAAVAARDRTKAARFGAPAMTIDEALRPGNPFEIVGIATDPSAHAPLALRAIEAGYHVLVEKPMAACSADAERMIAAARAAGRRLFVVSQRRFVPCYRVLALRLPGRRIARAKFRIDVTPELAGLAGGAAWKADPSAGGGLLAGTLVHSIDLLLRWFGPPAGVEAEDGARRVRACWSAGGVDVSIEARAEDGIEPAEIFEADGVTTLNRRFVRAPAAWRIEELARGAFCKAIPWRREPLARQFADIAAAIRTGRRAEVEGDDGLAALRLIEEIRRPT